MKEVNDVMKPSSPPPIPTHEDDRLVKSYVLYTLMLDMLAKDVAVLKHSSSKLYLSELYIRGLDHLQQHITHELTSTRRDMRARGIKVLEEQRGPEGIEVHYLCRGYRRFFSMLPRFAKSEVRRELSRLFQIVH